MNFFDTPITKEAHEEVYNVLLSERLSEGERVRKFELELEKTLGMKNVVAVNSGSSALHLSLVLAGVHEGDEVILPAQTFVATGLVVLQCGAKPVFADIHTDGSISVDDVIRKITRKTKAVIAVSWGGNPCRLKELSSLCSDRMIRLIQDNAQALGATYKSQPLSEFGFASCYSFQSIKHVTAGDGGALALLSLSDYEDARRLRWFGIDRAKDTVDETGERNYNLKEIGFKYHMSDYSAALGLGSLYGFGERIKRIKEIVSYYNQHLSEYAVPKKEGCSYWLYDLLVEKRSDFMKAMKERDVPTSVVHVGIHRNSVFQRDRRNSDLPIQHYWDEHHVCIPIHSSLTDEDVQKVIDSINKGW